MTPNLNDQSSLKNILNRIYACYNVESLNFVVSEALKRLPNYRKLIVAAKNEMEQKFKLETNISFEAREEKTRSTWFKFFSIQYIIYTLIIFPLVLYVFSSELKRNEIIYSYLFVVNGFSLLNLIDYYFAYRKKGTKWLTFLIITYVIQLSSMLVYGINTVVILQNIGIAINFYFHFNLLKINREGKIIKLLKNLKKSSGIN
jgi:hypothetical protein